MPELEVGGRTIHVTETGAHEPVVLLHAACSSSAQWRGVIEALLPAGSFRMLALDLQGYGATARWQPRNRLRLEDEFAPLRAVLAYLAGRPIHLVGHSYGAMIALRFALANQAAPLASLTLIEPIAFWLLREAGESRLFAEIQAIADAFAEAFDEGNATGAASGFIDYWSGPGTWRFLPAAVRDYAVATAGKVRCEWSIALGETETGAGLADHAGLRLPTVIVCGERTRAPARRVAELLHSAITGAELAGIPQAGHMSPVTHPGPVSEAIAGAVRRAVVNPLLLARR
jgi:pimeloyl-ACP methyl ester carboxylesterase